MVCVVCLLYIVNSFGLHWQPSKGTVNPCQSSRPLGFQLEITAKKQRKNEAKWKEEKKNLSTLMHCFWPPCGQNVHLKIGRKRNISLLRATAVRRLLELLLPLSLLSFLSSFPSLLLPLCFSSSDPSLLSLLPFLQFSSSRPPPPSCGRSWSGGWRQFRKRKTQTFFPWRDLVLNSAFSPQRRRL